MAPELPQPEMLLITECPIGCKVLKVLKLIEGLKSCMFSDFCSFAD
jgi:hypothetical protein